MWLLVKCLRPGTVLGHWVTLSWQWVCFQGGRLRSTRMPAEGGGLRGWPIRGRFQVRLRGGWAAAEPAPSRRNPGVHADTRRLPVVSQPPHALLTSGVSQLGALLPVQVAASLDKG